MRPPQQQKYGITPQRGNALNKKRCGPLSIAFAMLLVTAVLVGSYMFDLMMELETGNQSIMNAKMPNAVPKKTKIYPSVDCPSQVLTRNADGSTDPNNGMEESPKRLTDTTPPFWISLHKRHFDLLRWKSIMENGEYYERGITSQFQDILANTKHPGLVIDIGLNIGWFTLLARANGHNVAGFEPNPIMHTRVCESLKLNDWDNDNSVQVFPYGLSDQESIMSLTTGNNPGGSSFDETRLAKKFRKKMPVKVVMLDSIAQQEGWLDADGPTIHLMKVDVEGHEPNVFAGGNLLLNSGKIENIIMENSVTDERITTDLIATIYKAGYDIKLISTVNGDPYHPEMLPSLAKVLKTIEVGMPLEGLAEELKFLAKVTCNIWWTKR